jgi:hypothetical protein
MDSMFAMATPTPGADWNMWFTFEGTKMRTNSRRVGSHGQYPVTNQEPVNDYTLIVNLSEPTPKPFAIEGFVEYAS